MSRNVTISTTSLLVGTEAIAFPSPLIERAFYAVEEAGRQRSDIVCLPEEFDLFDIPPEKYKEVGEKIPGPITEGMQRLALRYNLYIISNIREWDDNKLYNTAVVIDRTGKIIGRYRKTHLAPGEEKEVFPGDEYPVFETDFGKIAVMICMDIHYPEICRIYALKGADIVFWPTQCLDYTGDHIESLLNARAIDNQIYCVSSHFVQQPFLAGKSMGHARIVDPYGRTRAETSHRPGIATAIVDLDESYETWYTGELKERYPTLKDTYLGGRRPETYGLLCKPDKKKLWKIKNPTLRAGEKQTRRNGEGEKGGKGKRQTR